MTINNSPDITNLIVQATWDISNPSAQVILENLSTGSNLAVCSWAFVTTSPSGTVIHDGNINQPDITGNWTDHVLTDLFPKPFNQIEFSGAPYTFIVIVKDSNGTVFTGTPQLASICRPNGNTNLSTDTYGIASSDVKVKCQDARVFFQDTTYTSYKGLAGVQVSSVLRVVYPIDETNNIPTPFVAAGYSTALVPISYSSPNYQFVQESVYDYDVSNNTFIRIKYKVNITFPVLCNVDLGQLQCEINKLIDQVETGNCSDVISATNKLGLITSKFMLVIMGITQPLTGVDVYGLIEEIKLIGGFDCNCCTAPSGIIPQTASIIDGYNFSVNKLGGDVNGNFSVSGNNITLNVGDVKYVVTVSQDSPSEVTAFSINSSLSNDGFTKTYYLNIDGQQLGIDVLNNIANNPTAVNLLNSLISVGSANFKLIVDGKCVYTSSSLYNYDFTLHNIPANTTFAILTSIKINGISQSLNFSFNGTNLTALQAYLNGLSLGTFVVSDLGSGNVLITSDNNPLQLSALSYLVANAYWQSDFSSTATGYVPISASQAVQNIIDYLCGINTEEIVTAQDYVICYIDPITNTKKTETIVGNSTLNALIIELLSKGCNTVDYIMSLGGVNCASIKGNFPVNNTTVMGANDVILGTKQGACASLSPIELGRTILELGQTDAQFLSMFCNFVIACSGGYPCEAYSLFTVSDAVHSPSDDEMDISVDFVHPSAISNTIRYARIDNTNSPVYTTITGVLPADTPKLIPNVPTGQYFVGITPIYADGRRCSETSGVTEVCPPITSFNSYLGGEAGYEHINIKYTAMSRSGHIKVVVGLPNGGTYSEIVVNDGSTIHIPLSTLGNQVGTYTVTLYPVCDVANGFFGQPTSSAILTVTPPPNSSIYNSNGSGNNLDGVSINVVSLGVTTNVLASASLAAGGGHAQLYVPSAFYDTVTVIVPISVTTIATAQIVAANGITVGVITGTSPQFVTFSNINVNSGFQITLT